MDTQGALGNYLIFMIKALATSDVAREGDLQTHCTSSNASFMADGMALFHS